MKEKKKKQNTDVEIIFVLQKYVFYLQVKGNYF